MLSAPTTKVDVTIRKPSALPFATPIIHVSRTAQSFDQRGGVYPVGRRFHSTQVSSGVREPRIFIGVGSNIGDRVGHVRRAVRALQAAGCTLVDTSRLYESEPMYVEDQDRFLNGAIEISTTLEPLALMRLLKRIETDIGRTKTFRNGPRVIDLDLVAYGDEVVRIGNPGDAPDADGVGWLEIPHAALAEREFVLRPLAEYVRRVNDADKQYCTRLCAAGPLPCLRASCPRTSRRPRAGHSLLSPRSPTPPLHTLYTRHHGDLQRHT